MSERIEATYQIETRHPLERAAEIMAGEQSTGTFVRLAEETDELRAAHAARVETVEELDEAAGPSLPGASAPPSAGHPVPRRALVRLSWPLANLGVNLPNVLATVAGNLFELKPFSGLRLLDVEFPAAFAERYPGPAFGISGTRELAGRSDGPLVGTIIKPSVGLGPEATASMVDKLCAGGIDFIKDDELQGDGPHCPFEPRVDAVMATIKRHEDRLGRRVMFAFNVTGDLDDMRRRHDHALAAGATCIMASIHSVGLVGLLELRRHSQLPIHAHRNGWGALSRDPALGFDYRAWQKFWRLAGADHMHVNGIRNKFCEPDESVVASARECLTPMFAPPHDGCVAMPVFSSGQWAGQAHDTYAAIGTTDLIVACGGGIMAHQGGITAGVRSIRQAWDAAMAGIPIEVHAREHGELAQAMATFGELEPFATRPDDST